MMKNDLRYYKTEKAIMNAFVHCVNTVGYEKTNVSLICRYADINRKTFYSHYLDKEDLLDKLYSKLKNSLLNSMESGDKSGADTGEKEGVADRFIYNIANNMELFQVLYKCYPRRVTDTLVLLYKHNMRLLIPDFEKHYSSDFFVKFRIEYGAGGMVRIMNEWFEEYKGKKIKELTAMCNELRKEIVNDILRHTAELR